MYTSPQHQRRSIRLPGYDYSQAGEYFITICTHERDYLFGEIVNDEMQLNAFGRIVDGEWQKSAEIRAEIELGVYVIMPNHFHAIVHILDSDDANKGMTDIQNGEDQPNLTVRAQSNDIIVDPCRGTARRAPTDEIQKFEKFGKPVPGSISTIVRSFKSAVTKQINEMRNTPTAPVWQSNYYEHIIQSEKEYLTIEAYIENNPANWRKDSLWPENR
jgi:REP element-mobilizing transposase RayT